MSATRKKSVMETVYAKIKEAIITLEYPPNHPLIEEKLAEECNASRTPVRNAIGRLQNEGFVTTVPARGAFVASLTLSDIKEVFDIRRALSLLALEIGMERIDREILRRITNTLRNPAASQTERDEAGTQLHFAIIEAARNKRISLIYGTLEAEIKRIHNFARSRSNPSDMHVTYNEHLELVEAIVANDPHRAKTLLAQHMINVRDRVLRTA